MVDSMPIGVIVLDADLRAEIINRAFYDFWKIDPRRATLFATVGVALSEAEKAGASAWQVSLFGEGAQAAGHSLVAAREWTEAERLAHEKAALGFYLSGHPYTAFAAELAPLIRQPLSGLQPKKETS